MDARDKALERSYFGPHNGGVKLSDGLFERKAAGGWVAGFGRLHTPAAAVEDVLGMPSATA